VCKSISNHITPHGKHTIQGKISRALYQAPFVIHRDLPEMIITRRQGQPFSVIAIYPELHHFTMKPNFF
jgi:hypothetical protein